MAANWLDKFAEEGIENRLFVEREMLTLDVVTKIAERMDELGMSKADFAKRIGKSKAYVTRLLKGDYNLTLGTISELAYYLEAEAGVELKTRAETSSASKIAELRDARKAR